MSRIIQFEGRSIEVPDDATDDEVASILESTSTPVAQPAPAEPSFFEKLGSGMNQVRDFMTNLSAPKQESVLQGRVMPDPQLDPALNEQAMLKSGSPDSVMFTAGRGKQRADRLTEQGKKVLAQRPELRTENIDRTFGEAAQDAAVSLATGAVKLPQAFVGIADIYTMGKAGKTLEGIGYRPDEAAQILQSLYSDKQKQASGRVQAADGFLETIKAALENPTAVGASALESIPSMLGGAGIARGLLAGGVKIAPWLAAALGEGAIGAGSAAEQIRNSTADRELTGMQAVSAMGSGVGTAMFGAAGGRLANRLGLGDMDTMLAAGTLGVRRPGFAAAVLGSGISEGAFEEMPQSAQEQMWQNFASGKPLLDGVGNAAGMGLVTGAAVGAVGGSVNNVAGANQQPAPAEIPSAEQLATSKGFLAQPAAPKVEDQPTTPAAPSASAVALGAILKREGLIDGEKAQETTPAPAAPDTAAEGTAAGAEVQPAPGAQPVPVADTRSAQQSVALTQQSPLSDLDAGQLLRISQDPANPLAGVAQSELKRREVEYLYRERDAKEAAQRDADARRLLDEAADQQIAQGAAVQDAQDLGGPTAMQRALANSKPIKSGAKLSPQAQDLQNRMRQAQNVGYGNTTTPSTPLDSTAQPGSPRPQRTDSQGRTDVVPQATGVADGQLAAATKAGSGAPATAGRVQLQLAQKADNDTILRNRVAVKRAKNVDIAVVEDGHPLTYEQKVVSHFAAKMGKTLTWVRRTAGPDKEMPDGWVNTVGGKHIFMDVNSSKPLLEILMHEGTHGLPSHIRGKLRDFVNSKVSSEGRAKFLEKYEYEGESKEAQDEEVLAYVAQNISRKPEFLQDLKTALGNKDFSAFVAHVLSKFKELMGGKGQSEFDSEFLGQHVKDVAEIHQRLVEAYTQAMQEQGLQPDQQLVGEQVAEPVMATKSEAQDTTEPSGQDELRQAREYEAKTGFAPYTSQGQIEVDLDTIVNPAFALKLSSKDDAYDPVFNLPLNKNGTVTLYYPTTNENARYASQERVLRGDAGANRVYLTNESSAPKVTANPGNISQELDGANVLVQIDPSLLQLDMEYEDGRKDFFVPIAEGEAFRGKMRQVKLFTQNAPRTKALSKDTKLTDMERSIESAITSYEAMSAAQKRERAKVAKDNLKRLHNVGTLLGVNGKLEKTNTGGYGLNNYEGRDVMSMGLGLASAQRINEQNLSSCPKSAICESLCLGETSGQNLLYGGEGQFKSGPRLSQYLKTEALVQSTEDFAIHLYREIERFAKAARKDDYQATVRLNVTSDFRPQMFGAIIRAFPDVMFYDYTKLPTKSIAQNHHLTYSSTGASQVVGGKTVVNKESNWDKMVEVMRRGDNVAMAFSDKNDMPSWVVDEKSGEKFQVWNGDNYDARFLDPKPGQPGNELGKGMIVGLTNKDRTGRPEDAAVKNNGFFLDYSKARDGDTLVIKDQQQLATGRKTIPIAKAPDAAPAFANKAGRNLDQDIILEIPVEGGGKAKLTVNAQQYINQLDKREEALRMVKECMA